MEKSDSWRPLWSQDPGQPHEVVASDGNRVAKVYGGGQTIEEDRLLRERHTRLIAAAPELAEALRELLLSITAQGFPPQEYVRQLDAAKALARAALAKAGLS